MQDQGFSMNPPEKPNILSISGIRKWKTEIRNKTKANKLCLPYSLQNKQNRTQPMFDAWQLL